jgi:uncharacterized protein (DUF2267 family)
VTGLEVFDTTVHTTPIWLKDLMQELGWEARSKASLGLRTTLHALRDRLTMEEAAQVAAQLPMLMCGLYDEGWDPTGKPQKVRHTEAFLTPVRGQCKHDPRVDAAQVARAVLY